MKIDSPAIIYDATQTIVLPENLPGVSSAQEKIRVRISQTLVASAVANVDFLLPPDFAFFELFIRDCTPSSGGADILMRFSFDEGASFISAANSYKYALYAGTTVTGLVNQISGGATNMLLSQTTNGLGNTAGRNYCSRQMIMNPRGNVMFPIIQGVSANVDNTGLMCISHNSGMYTGGASPVNAIRLLMSAGNITGGLFTLYGVQ